MPPIQHHGFIESLFNLEHVQAPWHNFNSRGNSKIHFEAVRAAQAALIRVIGQPDAQAVRKQEYPEAVARR